MRLSDEQYEEIKRTVTDTFEEYDIKGIPISAFEMATKMGITVVPYSSLNEEKQRVSFMISSDGYSIENGNNDWTIYYNDKCKSYGRINQTIMHEIGHYSMGHIGDGEEEEAEAKFFAKYALAPPPLIHNLDRPITIEKISQTFDISHQAAWIAYQCYQKWLTYGEYDYTDYEERLLRLFNIA